MNFEHAQPKKSDNFNQSVYRIPVILLPFNVYLLRKKHELSNESFA